MSNFNGQFSTIRESSATLQDAAVANGNGSSLVISLHNEVTFLVTGTVTPVFDVVFEVSFDDGVTWENAFLENLLVATGIGTLVNVAISPTINRYRYRVPAGADLMRARIATGDRNLYRHCY